MENTNLSEEAIVLMQLEDEITNQELDIEYREHQLAIKRVYLEKLKERKKSLLNYLNTDNN